LFKAEQGKTAAVLKWLISGNLASLWDLPETLARILDASGSSLVTKIFQFQGAAFVAELTRTTDPLVGCYTVNGEVRIVKIFRSP
jgi:hypothetical protein